MCKTCFFVFELVFTDGEEFNDPLFISEITVRTIATSRNVSHDDTGQRKRE